MFRILRYIFMFLIIMVCLFILQKSSPTVRTSLDEAVLQMKLYFKSIGNATSTVHGDIYNQINKQDFVGGLGTTTVKKNIEIRSFSQSSPPQKPKAKISIDGIIYYTNIEREKAGLAPLVKNIKLNTSASLKTDDMFAKQYFEHTSPDGKTAADLVKSAGYTFQVVGENLALGVFETDQVLVQAWMNSPAHRANILNSKYTEMGASVGMGEYKGQTQWLAVQHFAKPMPTCTPISSTTQDSIDTEKLALESEERELQTMAGVIESDPSAQRVDKAYINTYNDKVNGYNIRLNKLRDTIAEFNKTIVQYNTCVTG